MENLNISTMRLILGCSPTSWASLRCTRLFEGENTPAIHDLLDARLQTRNSLVPQADDLNKVFELLTLVEAGINRSAEVSDYFVFEHRQSNYYREAAEYLGLITVQPDRSYSLTDQGIAVLAEATGRRAMLLAKIVINSWVFVDLIQLAGPRKMFTDADIDMVIARARNKQGGTRYGGTTIRRRRQTIVAWIGWLSREMGCFTIAKDGTYQLR